MNTMSLFAWILPIMFMLHDFEEIIMAEVWNTRFQMRINTTWTNWKPFGLKYIQHFQTPTFSIGVGVEFLVFSLISLFSVIFRGYFLWYSAFFTLILHYVIIHLLLSIKFKGYVPGVITSVLFIFPGIWALYGAAKLLNYGLGTIMLACLIGILLMYVFFQMLHRLMGLWSEMLYKYTISHNKRRQRK